MNENDSNSDDKIALDEAEEDISMFMKGNVDDIKNRITDNLLTPSSITESKLRELEEAFVTLPSLDEILVLLLEIPSTMRTYNETNQEVTRTHAIHMTIMMRLLIGLANRTAIDDFVIQRVEEQMKLEMSDNERRWHGKGKLDS